MKFSALAAVGAIEDPLSAGGHGGTRLKLPLPSGTPRRLRKIKIRGDKRLLFKKFHPRATATARKASSPIITVTTRSTL